MKYTYLFTILMLISSMFAGEDKNRKDTNKGRNKVVQNTAFIKGNNLEAMMTNYGRLFWNGDASGLLVPSPVFTSNTYSIKGDGPVATVFASGLWVAGKLNGSAKAAASIYTNDYAPGEITGLNGGNAVFTNPDSAIYKLYYYFSAGHKEYLNDLLNSPDNTPDGRVHAFATEQLDLATENGATEWAKAVAQGAPAVPPGDVAVFCIYHDASDVQRAAANLHTDKMNVQVRQLTWLFRAPGDPIDNTIFIKFEFINKNTVPITEFYATVWADSDLGNYTDDYVGSDVDLGLGYTYNAVENDAHYSDLLGIAPPALGYDFLQGAVIDNAGTDIARRGTDFYVYVNKDSTYTAIAGDVTIANKKVLGSSSFVYYNNTSADDGNPGNTAEIYNYMKARTKTGLRFPAQVKALNANLTTEARADFFFNGDPALGEGWIENSTPSDRRFMINCGPFDLGVYSDTNGDGKVNEGDAGVNAVVAGVLTSFGLDNRNSVSVLKFEDNKVQDLFNKGFVLSPSLPAPKIQVVYDDEEFSLTWQSASINYKDALGATKTTSTESYDIDGYKFQGYQLVQFENEGTESNKKIFKKVAYFDKRDGVGVISSTDIEPLTGLILNYPVVKGTDLGVKNDYHLTQDIFSTLAGKKFLNNVKYYFGLRAYAYNSAPGDGKTYVRFGGWATNLSPIIARVKNPNITVYAAYDDALTASETGLGNLVHTGVARARVVNPQALKNGTYTLKVDSTNREFEVSRKTGGVTTILDTVPYNNENAETELNTKQVEGISFSVYGPRSVDAGIASVTRTGTAYVTLSSSFAGLNFLSGTTSWAGDFLGTDVSIGNAFPVKLEFTGKTFEQDSSKWSRGVAYNRHGTPAYQVTGVGRLPLIAWDVTDPASPRRLDVSFVESSTAGVQDNVWGNDASNRHYLIVRNTNYDPSQAMALYGAAPSDRTKNAVINFNASEGNTAISLTGATAFATDWSINIKVHITMKNNTKFEIVSPGAPTTFTNFSSVVSNINVVPNPYFGNHSEETNEPFIKFINLPEKCDISVYSLSGELVYNVTKANSSPELNWNLQNNGKKVIGSGVYFAMVKLTDGSVKKLKLAIIVGQNRLLYY